MKEEGVWKEKEKKEKKPNHESVFDKNQDEVGVNCLCFRREYEKRDN